MLLTSPSEEHLNICLREAISHLCKNGLMFKSELTITGLLAIAIDRQEVVVVNIQEVILDDRNEGNDATLSSSECDLICVNQSCDTEVHASDKLHNAHNAGTVLDDAVTESLPQRVLRNQRVRQRKRYDSNQASRHALENLSCKEQRSSEQLMTEPRLSVDDSYSCDRPLSHNGTRSSSPSDLICIKLEPGEQISDESFLAESSGSNFPYNSTTSEYKSSEFLGDTHSIASLSTAKDLQQGESQSSYHLGERSMVRRRSKIASAEDNSAYVTPDTVTAFMNTFPATYEFRSSAASWISPVHRHRDSRASRTHDGEGICCNNCGTSKTTTWRRCPADRTLLCNACGCYYKIHQVHRPLSMASEVIRSRRRRSAFDSGHTNNDLGCSPPFSSKLSLVGFKFDHPSTSSATKLV